MKVPVLICRPDGSQTLETREVPDLPEVSGEASEEEA